MIILQGIEQFMVSAFSLGTRRRRGAAECLNDSADASSYPIPPSHAKACGLRPVWVL